MNCFGYSENYVWLTTFNLGRGAFGVVYKGVHKQTGDEVAVKTFTDERPSEIHIREFEVTKVLSHQNIVKVIAIEHEVKVQRKILIMELCRGGNLQKILDDPENMDGLEEKDFLCVLKDLTAGLKYLRDNNIVHRDLKPANIMKYIGEDGSFIYKLADFGSARYLDDDQQYQSMHGTEEYLHPDIYQTAVFQKHGKKAFKAKADLWSIGATIYQMATGSLPFRPFGGRQNRETMLYIHNHKPSCAISGVQHAPNQPIEWSYELPRSCLLNQGLRELVTDLLVGILERNLDKMWTFDQFFARVTDIMSRKIFHVFYMNKGREICLYMHPHKMLQDLKVEIFNFTKVPAPCQLLLFDKSLFLPQIDPLSDLSKFPTTTLDCPLILLHIENADSKGQPQLEHIYPNVDAVSPLFPSPLTSTESDASVAERCCVTAYVGKRLLVKIVRCQRLLLQIPQIILSIRTDSISKMYLDLDALKSKVDGISYRCKLLKKSFSVISQFISGLSTAGDNHDNNVRIMCNNMKGKVSEEIKSVNKVKRKFADMLSSFHTLMEHGLISVNGQSIDKELFEYPHTDKWIQQANTYVGKIRDTWEVFMRHKKKKVLTVQDQQLHMLERMKMENTNKKLFDLQVEAMDVYLKAFYKLNNWDRCIETVTNRHDRMERIFQSACNDLSSCSSSLQQVESELFEFAERIITDEFYVNICPNLRQSEHKKKVLVINENVESDEEQNKGLLEKLQACQMGQQSLQKGIEENKSLIESFDSISQIIDEDINMLLRDPL